MISDLLPRIVCPSCKAPLEASPTAAKPVSLQCTRCGSFYPIIDGIPVLLAERAAAVRG